MDIEFGMYFWFRNIWLMRMQSFECISFGFQVIELMSAINIPNQRNDTVNEITEDCSLQLQNSFLENADGRWIAAGA